MMVANVFIQAKNPHCGFDFCPPFRDWPVARNRAGKVASIEEVANESHTEEDDLADRAGPQCDGLLLRSAEAVAPALRTVSERPTFVRRLGRVAA